MLLWIPTQVRFWQWFQSLILIPMTDALPVGIIDEDWKGFNDSEDSQILWQTVFRNRAVMDTYEPGSVFKAITAVAAIEGKYG